MYNLKAQLEFSPENIGDIIWRRIGNGEQENFKVQKERKPYPICDTYGVWGILSPKFTRNIHEVKIKSAARVEKLAKKLPADTDMSNRSIWFRFSNFIASREHDCL